MRCPLRAYLAARRSVRQITGHEAQCLVRDRNAILVDVRQAYEYAAGHIGGATHVPLGALDSQAGALPRDRPIVVVCASGRRSLLGARRLTRAGFTEVFSLRGGIRAWDVALKH